MTKVLYVEDNDDNIYMMRLQFELLDGFEFLTAEDGESGYAKAKAELPDIILMDLDLPILNGWEVTRRLKDDATTRHIPVIALTAHAMAGSREQALAAGCDDFDTKPINFQRLLQKVDQVLGSSRRNC
ncbi:MAG: response regulator [Pseudolabrys sp.]|nr:response regulator [Pseudolabrys sp.]